MQQPLPTPPAFNRRRLLAAAVALGAAPSAGLAQPPGVRKLTDGVALITPAERAARIARAQALMQAQGFAAIITEPGPSMDYFTGVQWRRSERAALVIIPRDGEAGLVVPKFEEGSIRETLVVPADVRTWEEDESPYRIAAGWLADQGIASGRIGMEETTRGFLIEGMEIAMPSAQVVSGAAIFRGCRMIKTPAEIALMQAATDITIAAYRHTWPLVRAGMRPADIGALMSERTVALGGRVSFNLILIGEASAYPHGSKQPQVVREGEIVLMDCGCNVGGYESDVSRTFVFGQANARQRQVWDQVHKGQEIAFAAARLGAPTGQVDDAVRTHYASLGYGPDYRLPGLSHRTGHGIGMDGHEPVNLVRGETTRLAPGMCFSNEPGIYIPGQFGVRLEDCFHMTPQGPKWFSKPPPSIDDPMG